MTRVLFTKFHHREKYVF